MTVRRSGEEKVEELSWGKGTKAYRLILLGVALAATPIGQNILAGMGIQTPVATELGSVKADIAAVKEDVKNLKADVAAVKAKSDKLDTEFTGFQVDFKRYQAKPQ